MARPRGQNENVESYQLAPNGLIYYPFYDIDKPNYIFTNYYVGKKPLEETFDLERGKKITITYASSEHYFQSQKFPYGKDPNNHKAIANSETPDQARQTGQKKKLSERDKKAWEAKGAYAAMVDTIHLRAEQDANFRTKLLSTGDGYLMEDTYTGPSGVADKIWGAGREGEGTNLLGKALMQVRHELRYKYHYTNRKEGDAFNKHQQFEKEFASMIKRARDERREFNDAMGTNLKGTKTGNGKVFQDLVAYAEEIKLQFKSPWRHERGAKTATPMDTETLEVEPKPSGTFPDYKRRASVNLLLDVNLKKIRAAAKAMELQSYQELEEGENKRILKFTDKKSTMEKNSYEFTVHPNKLTTTQSEVITFKIMLESLRAVHGEDVVPKIETSDATAAKNWITALQVLGYENPKKYINPAPSLKAEESEEESVALTHKPRM